MWQRIKTKLVAAWLAASLLWRSFLALFEGTHSMADSKKTEAELLETLKAKMDAAPVSKSPVGHTPPFSGDLTVIGHCAKVAYDEIRAGNYTSETLHAHLAQGYGEAAVLGLEDEPQPVGAAAGLPGWLTLFLNLILLIGQKQ